MNTAAIHFAGSSAATSDALCAGGYRGALLSECVPHGRNGDGYMWNAGAAGRAPFLFDAQPDLTGQS
jgi:hypothetical protein